MSKNIKMDKIYKICLHTYRIILILALPTYLISYFLVGAAGHNSTMKIENLVLLGFLIIVPTLLTILVKIDNAKIQLKKALCIILIVLIWISVLYFFYGLYDFWSLFQNERFELGDSIPVLFIIFFIALSSVLLVGLVKNKI